MHNSPLSILMSLRNSLNWQKKRLSNGSHTKIFHSVRNKTTFQTDDGFDGRHWGCNYWQKKLKASGKQQLKLNKFLRVFFFLRWLLHWEKQNCEKFFFYESTHKFGVRLRSERQRVLCLHYMLLSRCLSLSRNSRNIRERKMQLFADLWTFFSLARSRVFLKGKIIHEFLCVWDNYLKYGKSWSDFYETLIELLVHVS